MRRKTKAAILLIIGFFFFFSHTIIILFIPFHFPTIPGPSQIIDPVRYWQAWFVIQGGQALLNVIIGLTLIIIGSRYFVIKEQ